MNAYQTPILGRSFQPEHNHLVSLAKDKPALEDMMDQVLTCMLPFLRKGMQKTTWHTTLQSMIKGFSQPMHGASISYSATSIDAIVNQLRGVRPEIGIEHIVEQNQQLTPLVEMVTNNILLRPLPPALTPSVIANALDNVRLANALKRLQLSGRSCDHIYAMIRTMAARKVRMKSHRQVDTLESYSLFVADEPFVIHTTDEFGVAKEMAFTRKEVESYLHSIVGFLYDYDRLIDHLNNPTSDLSYYGTCADSVFKSTTFPSLLNYVIKTVESRHPLRDKHVFCTALETGYVDFRTAPLVARLIMTGNLHFDILRHLVSWYVGLCLAYVSEPEGTPIGTEEINGTHYTLVSDGLGGFTREQQSEPAVSPAKKPRKPRVIHRKP